MRTANTAGGFSSRRRTVTRHPTTGGGGYRRQSMKEKPTSVHPSARLSARNESEPGGARGRPLPGLVRRRRVGTEWRKTSRRRPFARAPGFQSAPDVAPASRAEWNPGAEGRTCEWAEVARNVPRNSRRKVSGMSWVWWQRTSCFRCGEKQAPVVWIVDLQRPRNVRFEGSGRLFYVR